MMSEKESYRNTYKYKIAVAIFTYHSIIGHIRHSIRCLKLHIFSNINAVMTVIRLVRTARRGMNTRGEVSAMVFGVAFSGEVGETLMNKFEAEYNQLYREFVKKYDCE